jgi:mediator of RNA polymerase II transcription subunit 12
MELHKIPSQHQVALLWSLKRLMTHPALVYYPTMMEFVFDVALLLHDSISDDARQHFTKLDAVKSLRDPRCTFLFGSSPSIDRWLALAKPVTLATNSQPTPSSQPATPSTDQNQNPMQQTQLQQPLQNRTTPGASPHPLQRSLSQQQRQLQTPQTQNSNRMYPQYPANPQYPHQRMWSPYPQMPSASGQAQNPQMSQYQQMQRMQQIQQSMAQQQRNMQGPPVPQQTQQQQRQMAPTLTQPSGTSQGGAGKGTAGAGTVPTKQDAVEMRMFPFAVKPWEILPESGGNAQANETAISLGLFGARKV